MEFNVYYCENCNKTSQNIDDFFRQYCSQAIDFSRGYISEEDWDNEEQYKSHICPYCGNHLIDTGMKCEDFDILGKITSYNRELLDAMIELRKKNIIEYESRMVQFRLQGSQLNSVQTQENQASTPHCLSCGSTNLRKISVVSKAGSVALWGIFSQKVKKQFHCENCGYEW